MSADAQEAQTPRGWHCHARHDGAVIAYATGPEYRCTGYVLDEQCRVLTPDAETLAKVEADARLFAAARELLAAAQLGLLALERDRDCLLESHCLLNADETPNRDTLDDDAREDVEELEAEIAAIAAAIAKASTP